MSDTSIVRRASPVTDLKSFAGAAPHGYQQYLQVFLDAEQEAAIESTLDRIGDSSPAQLKNDDSVPFIPDVVSQPIYETSEFILHVNVTDDEEEGEQYIQRTYDIYDDHQVALICYEELEDTEFEIIQSSVNRISSNSFNVELDIENHERSRVQSQIEDAPHVGVASVFSPLVFDRERAAIDALPEESRLWSVITGQREIAFDHDAVVNSEPLDEQLYENRQQATAIDEGLQASDIYCVQGPPGTGKTRYLIELVRRFAAAGERVLVTAETNTAVDNILIRSGDQPDERSLYQYGERDDEFRIARANARRSNSSFVRNNVSQHTYSAEVVCSTNNSAHYLVEEGQEFDVLVSDEAAQARKTSTFIPLRVVDRAIFVGDHKQLPATRESKPLNDIDGRHRSVFELLYDNGLYGEEGGIQFDTQYRMLPALAEFSSNQFYDGSIQTGVNHDPLLSCPVGLFDLQISDTEEEVETSLQNQREANAVAAQVVMLIKNGVSPEDIGVIAPYSAQEELIRSQLQTLSIDGTEHVRVATIDRFQGSEKEAIVVSFTRSNSDADIGFLAGDDGKNRLNVALTRARRYCALVGDWQTLREASPLYESLYTSVTERFQPKTYTEDDIRSMWNHLT
jgi:thymidine kinase